MATSALELRDLLATRVLVLDGATGTELEQRGVPTPRPRWSAAALTSHPEVVAAIHGDYAEAGADIIVANTFRTNVRTLRAAGMSARGEELNLRAIELARHAVRDQDSPQRSGEPDPAGDQRRLPRGARNDTPAVLVAASVAPVEDCYSPELVPDEASLEEEHTRMLAWLKAARPDLVWIETMNTIREARAAAQAAADAELPFVVSFVVREDGNLLSGERLEEAAGAVESSDPVALGLNCIPPRGLTALLPRLRQATARPLIAYGHVNNPQPIRGWSYAQSATPDEYARYVQQWLELGASIVGGCCGTTPEHIRAVRRQVDRAGPLSAETTDIG
jgi:S-methylmethionine-dependent homocysteine/selenocysteine methylase